MFNILIDELKTVNHLLNNDYDLLASLGIDLLKANDKELLPAFVLSRHKDGINSSYLAAACQCFYLFFRLHSLSDQETRKIILLGDYFFSRFMELLMLSGNIALLDHFSNFVINKSQSKTFNKEFALGELLPFISYILQKTKKETKRETTKEYATSIYTKNIIRPAGLN